MLSPIINVIAEAFINGHWVTQTCVSTVITEHAVKVVNDLDAIATLSNVQVRFRIRM